MESIDSHTAKTPETRDIYTVSRLNKEVGTLLDRGFPSLWLEAEISNLARPSSGHWYFSLKDAQAQLRCAMFRQRNSQSKFVPRDGQKVLVRGRIGLYEPRGEYQLIIDHIEDAGQGALQREFERLKVKLAAEGLFAQERKRPLPALPRRIGVITSPTGAVISDILHVLKRRFAAAAVLIYPVPVQGAQAAPDIIASLRLAGQRRDCDVLILARGGGSLEDLWAFNDESLARAICASPIPVISAIGHEVDFTLADFAADVRAPTPSAAAEIVVPDAQAWLRIYRDFAVRLTHGIHRQLRRLGEQVRWLRGRAALVSPRARLAQQAQRLDYLEQSLLRSWREGMTQRRSALVQLQGELWHASPRARLADGAARHAALLTRLRAAANAAVLGARYRLQPLVRTLNALSPLATLDRGYAIVSSEDGAILRDAQDAKIGAPVRVRLARGGLAATVKRRTP
jgi:exodeoxyribonuclease VII large subunit